MGGNNLLTKLCKNCGQQSGCCRIGSCLCKKSNRKVCGNQGGIPLAAECSWQALESVLLERLWPLWIQPMEVQASGVVSGMDVA